MEPKNQAKPKGNPVHKVCEENVEKPTLIKKEQGNNDIRVWLQWFGESDSFDLSDKQFLFPINTDIQNFFFSPEAFEIIMIGPVKNWPNKEVVNQLIEQCGGENVTIIYFISSQIGVADDNDEKTIPAAGILPLNIKLGDDNCGIISPQKFFDDSVRINAIERFQSKR